MSQALRTRIFDQLDALTLVDPHSHIDPLRPASASLADVLGYHYYTELAHSAGMPQEQIEEPGLDPREKCARLIARLSPLENTIQYSWLVEMARVFFGFSGERITVDNWESVYDAAAAKMSQPDWAEQVLRISRLEAVFLTNDFDDPLQGFDPQVYIPCLRTDDLVFHLARPEVRERLEKATQAAVGSSDSLVAAIAVLFDRFTSCGARACAISLPPDFAPARVSAGRADTAIREVFSRGPEAAGTHRQALAHFVFWTLADCCAQYGLPFDLMIGVNRNVYPAGVHQGRDLYDSRVSLIQYRELFNAFPRVAFPVSVLASVTNQELVSYAWIFPNVVTSGHWWYSNTPALIERDLAVRLEAVPQTKQIGYYSDMYKLEFGLPKFAMYKRVLAKVLAEQFVLDRGWSEERAVELGRRVLRQNVDEIFASRPRLAGGRAAAEADSRTQPPAVTGAELAAAGSESAGLAAALDTADEFRPAIASEAGLEAAGVAEPGDASGVELNDFAAEKSEEPPAATGAKAADSDVEDWLDAINRLSGPDTPRR